MRRAALALVAAAGLSACDDLPDVDRGICGNGVIEAGEDCEAATLDDSGNVIAQCGEADGDNACFFVWDDTVGCPVGMGQGSDGRCRQPTGEFETGGALRLVVDDLEVGDVDGDGFDDVITQSGTTVQVSFGSTQADLASSVITQVATSGSGLEVGDVDDDGFDDVLVATSPGVQTFLGAEDRALDPFSYPQLSFPGSASFVLGFSVDVDPTSPQETVLTIWNNIIGFPIVIGGDKSLIPLPTPAVGAADASRLVTVGIERLARHRDVASDLDPSLEVALGYVGEQQVHLYQATSGPIAITDPGVTLDAGGVLRPGSGLFFGYFDADGCPDLLANVGVANSRLIVFRGTAIAGPDCSGVLQAPIDLMTLTDDQMRVLGVTDFDGDGVSDLVTNRGLFRVNGTSAWTLTAVSTVTEPYLDAVIVDINGDDALDVAAFRESLPDVDVLVNASSPGLALFNRFVVPTSEAVLRLAEGDFDGDLTHDVAIVETDGGSQLTVGVAFGTFHGPPSARVVMDRFTSMAGFLSAPVVGSTGEPDAADDLIVATDNPDGARIDVTTLFGSGARAMTAPLVLTAIVDDEPVFENPVALVLGQLHEERAEDQLDLFSVGFGLNDLSDAFLFEGDGTGGLIEEEQESWPRVFESQDAVWASGDIDGDGMEEIAAAEQHSRRQEPGLAQVVLFDPHPDAVGEDPTLDSIDNVLGAHAITFADFDGDGDNDLMVAFDAKGNDAGLDDENITVAWNAGDALAAPERLPGSAGCIDAVSLQLDSDEPPELIALCRVSIVPSIPFELRRFDAVEPETLVSSSEPIARITAARTTRLRVGDVDGDGLDDLVVSTRGGEAADVHILLQRDVHDED